ncbi:kinase-like protein [Sporodiniella umbellata]|nr:kinase-like protein [Sporodiniella umbellata]
MGAICCKEDFTDLSSQVELSHFALLRSVGKGAFGKVRIVQHKGTKRLYALKYINKDKCISMKAVNNIISERHLLERINYSLIVNLCYAFQDNEHVFMILDLMLGGDLRFHLERFGRLPEDYVQFYAAELSLALNYLHHENIVHRDLKPDNILLDNNGHAHLTDFNIAVKLDSKDPRLLKSIAGSMAYIAPEMLSKEGYSYSVDWWSLGVLLYELLYGKRPFRAKSSEELQKAILTQNVELPEISASSNEAADFIQNLLNRDPTKRLGVGVSGFERLKSHSWLKNIQWEILDSKTTRAPFIPDASKSNFDPTHELEEVLLEDNPLKYRRKAQQKSTCSYRSSTILDQCPNRTILDQKFTPYDYTKPFNSLAMSSQYSGFENSSAKMGLEKPSTTSIG